MNCKLLLVILILSSIVACNPTDSPTDTKKVSSANVEEVKAKEAKPEVENLTDEERFWNIISTEQDDKKVLMEFIALIEKGIDPNLKNGEGDTPLSYAVEKGKSELVKVLLQAGAGREHHGEEEQMDRLVELAVHNEDFEIVDLLLKSGAHFEGGNEAMLIKAVEEEQSELIQLLLHNGYSPNQEATIEGVQTTLLNHALKQGNEELVTLLLNAGANPNFAAEDSEGNALSVAVSEGKSADMLTHLLAKGGDPNSVHEGKTLIHHAIKGENPELVETLLVYGAYAQSEEERMEVSKLAEKHSEIASLLTLYGW